MNCQVCGRHLSRTEMGKWKKDGHPICSDCRKGELREKIREATHPSQIELLERNKDDELLIDEILKEQIPPRPRRSEVGPDVMEKKVETIELQLVQIKAQISGIKETMATLGYDVASLRR